MRYIGYALVVIHLFLIIWSTGGIIELISLKVPWTPYTNQDFPQWLLPVHWGSVIITSVGFIVGYFTRWSWLPQFMLAAYSMLFTICVIETLGFMTNSTKYIAMVAEFVAYAVILILLFKHKYFINYFKISV